ncbi:uncharacterized protein LOC126552114 isoform X3 [Aphis gossypii]|uniref:DBF4-type domain-containing protein n=1 Tax=Aphis gossypii TaxID=80765 RepID=A0A9P0NK96_APHGO|nr:uncharacterized protein LOC114132795 isoform X3 [Aphis gossypii]XP_050062578.1 uncharacterized protein LOC126552114 isoform X3 [Aphis gossypii]CAH1732686.1 unnamed protein product [Aphis gossypii]
MSVENLNNRRPSSDHTTVLGSSSKNKRSILYGKTFVIDIVDNIISSKVEKLINAYGGFQHWLKSLLKKCRTNKKPTDQVASVLKGKVSLKIESMDQGQRPVFEFIPKWPDLGDALCKKKTKHSTENKYIGDKSGDDYSSDQYSTSEIGGMCELCDMPFMNYKEHINTKKHMRESQDEQRFHELDELINERPLNVIFNQFIPNKSEKKINRDQNLAQKTPNLKNCIDDTVITIIDSDSDDTEQKDVHCSFGNKTFKEQASVSLKRKYQFSDSDITFVPQKRPSKKLHSPVHDEINFYKKTKRKRKTHQKPSYKDIYKVEVVNSHPSKSNNDKIESDQPPVIIRLKRVQNSKNEYSSSDVESHRSMSSSDNDDEIPKDPTPDHRYIRVVRKPSFSDGTEISPSKGYTESQMFTFEHPELRHNIYKDIKNISYYPTYTCIPDTKSSIEYIQEKMENLGTPSLNCTLSYNESLKVMSKMEPQKIGEWFYNIPKKIHDNLSFNSSTLVPLTDLSKIKSFVVPKKKVNRSSTSSNSIKY